MYKLFVGLLAFISFNAWSYDVPITGNVESKCVIQIDTSGVYGNPTPDKLSTVTTDGGVLPVVRYDVILADAYKAYIKHPNLFTTSPPLNDVVYWSGQTEVAEVSDANMSAYETNKIEYDNTTEFDLTIAGSTWFKTTSTAEYGVGKAFPGGDYTAVVEAECIAK